MKGEEEIKDSFFRMEFRPLIDLSDGRYSAGNDTLSLFNNKYINLRNNKISSLPYSFFRQHEDNYTIDLGDNLLTSVPTGSNEMYASVVSLIMDHNLMNTITIFVFLIFPSISLKQQRRSSDILIASIYHQIL
jgi:hypothetical protein